MLTPVAAPNSRENEFEMVDDNPEGANLNVNGPAVPVITRSVNEANPDTAVLVFVPVSVPLPEEIEAATLTFDEVTVFPPESVIRTTG